LVGLGGRGIGGRFVGKSRSRQALMALCSCGVLGFSAPVLAGFPVLEPEPGKINGASAWSAAIEAAAIANAQQAAARMLAKYLRSAMPASMDIQTVRHNPGDHAIFI
jgi:hypothetical protein